MATSTTKLGLTKPDYTDVVDVADLNTNADLIDAAAGFTIVADAAARPASPWTGQVIYQVDVASSFMWDGSAWQPAGGGGGSIEISSTAPASPSAGDLWWDSDNGNLYIYYDDGDSQQWVAANGPQVFVGTSAPDGYQGQLWFDSTEGKVYIYYDDGSSSQWVSAIGGSLAGSIVQVVRATDSTVRTTTSGSLVDANLSVSITPKSASSNLLIVTSVRARPASNDYIIMSVTDSSNVAISGAEDFAVGSSNTNVLAADASTVIGFVSPGSTSPVTYKLRFRSLSGGTATLQNNGLTAQMYAIEIAG
jgi:hypothetical protein